MASKKQKKRRALKEAKTRELLDKFHQAKRAGAIPLRHTRQSGSHIVLTEEFFLYKPNYADLLAYNNGLTVQPNRSGRRATEDRRLDFGRFPTDIERPKSRKLELVKS